jgi:hypothetical protein
MIAPPCAVCQPKPETQPLLNDGLKSDYFFLENKPASPICSDREINSGTQIAQIQQAGLIEKI